MCACTGLLVFGRSRSTRNAAASRDRRRGAVRSRRRELGMECPCLAGQAPRCVPRFQGCVEGSLTDRSVGVLARQGLGSRSASHSLLSSQYTSAGELPSVDFESSSQRPSLDPLIRLKRLPHVRKKDQFQELSSAVRIPLTDIHSKTMIQCDERY